MSEPIRYLDTDIVTSLLEKIDVVGIVSDALQKHALDQAVLPAEAYLRWTTEDGWARSLSLPAALGQPTYAAGVKVINGNVANPSRGIARAGGLILLADVRTGHVTTVMSAAPVSAIRTAAVSIVGVRHLAPQEIERALVVGAGPLGEAHVRLLHREIPELQTISVYDIDPGRTMALAERTRKTDVMVHPADHLASAVEEADVVITATTSTEGYLGLGDVSPDTLVINVGLDDCAEDLLLGADQVVVDSWELVSEDTNRLLGRLIRDGVVAGPEDPRTEAQQDVVAELGQIVAGTVSFPRTGQGRVVLNPFGMAVNDIAVAAALERLAIAQSTGLPLQR